MAKETVEVLIEGGKATAAPPLGPALGPMGLNIGQVVADINKKTSEFKGMQVPVKIIIDSGTKEYKIEVGTPPASSLILKAAKLKKGSGKPLTEKVGSITMQQAREIAELKLPDLNTDDVEAGAKIIAGTARQMGIEVK